MSIGKRILSGLTLAGGLLLTGSASLHAAPQWAGGEPGLGAQAIDGSLRLDLPLGVLPGGSEFAFPLTLQHGLESRDQDPGVVTRWSIPQLISYVVPGQKDSLLWIQPGGDRIVFEKDEILSSIPDRFTREWVCLARPADVHEMISRDGWSYRYQKGILQSLEAPSGRKLTFEMDRTRMLSAVLQGRGKVLKVLSVEWSEDGRPLTVAVGPVEHELVYREAGKKGGGDFRLTEWRASTRPESPVQFDYAAGLLTAVERDGPGTSPSSGACPATAGSAATSSTCPSFPLRPSSSAPAKTATA